MIVVRLTLERMKEEILAAFSAREVDLTEHVRRQLDATIAAFDWDKAAAAAIEEAFAETVRDEMRSYFRYGDGRRAIKAALAEQLAQEVERARRGCTTQEQLDAALAQQGERHGE